MKSKHWLVRRDISDQHCKKSQDQIPVVISHSVCNIGACTSTTKWHSLLLVRTAVRSLRCDLLLQMYRGLCVCLSVCLCTCVQKRVNQSKCRLSRVLEWAQGTIIRPTWDAHWHCQANTMRWIDLCSGGDAVRRYRYCSSLLMLWQAGVDVSDLYCRHHSQCLLPALSAQNVGNVPCAQIRKSLDIIAETTLNCAARAAIYKCVQTSLPYVAICYSS